MKSIILLCGVLGAVADTSECQADENSLLQARKHVRTTKVLGSHDSKAMLKSVRDVANSLLEGSDTTMTTDEVNDALEAASEALAELSPTIRQQVENAQQQINHASSAVQACHGDEMAEMRTSAQESYGRHSAAVESCHNTLNELQAAETEQCNTAEDCLCDEARTRTTDQEALCTATTEIYEVAFCEHHHFCVVLHQCHSDETEVYQSMRADVEAEMALIVQEYIAVEQSRCLTGLIMEAMTPPVTPISHAALTACDDVDTSALDIHYPDLPAEPAACPAHEHGDPQCEAHEHEFVHCTSDMRHTGKYLWYLAGGDGAVRPIQESMERCVELGDQCMGITCAGNADESCTVREGRGGERGGSTDVVRNSPSNEFSYLKVACVSHCPSHAAKYLPGHAAGDSTIRNIEESQERCVELGGQCGGITCRASSSGPRCTVRAGGGLRGSPSNEFSFVKAECHLDLL